MISIFLYRKPVKATYKKSKEKFRIFKYNYSLLRAQLLVLNNKKVPLQLRLMI